MAMIRWTRSRQQTVAVVALIGGVAGIALSWLLSHIVPFVYELAEFE
jgi:hypothetical protein